MLTTTILAVLFLGVFSTEAAILTQVITTTSGPLRGQTVHSPHNITVSKYLGIRYGKADRFKPCKEVKWTVVYDAVQEGKPCPQPVSTYGVTNLKQTSEDCHNLDIYVPSTKTKNLPVMVFVQDFFYTYSSKDIDGVAVASRGEVIVITLNYRLGVLGYIKLTSSKGNLGLLDNIAALQWINRNIERFGGNPNDVTLVGHSTAAMAVGLLLISPQAQGLFKRAIMMSGSPLSPLATIDQSQAALNSRQIGEYFKCANITALEECLATKSVSEIIQAQQAFKNTPIQVPFGPIVDSDVIPDFPDKLFQANKFTVDSVIIGVKDDDGQIFRSTLPGIVTTPSAPVHHDVNESVFSHIVQGNKWFNKGTIDIDIVKYQYTDWTNPNDDTIRSEKLTDLYTDTAFNAPIVRLADVISKRGIPTFFYSITKRAFNKTTSGVNHGDDVRWLFGQQSSNEGIRDVIDSAFDMWMNFVKSGNPSHPSNVTQIWPTYTPNGHYITITTNITNQSKFLPDRMAFWNILAPSLTSQQIESTPTPTVMTTTSSHDNGYHCENKKDTTKALTAVVAVMGIVIIVMLSIIIYQTRMLSKIQDANSNTS